MRRRQDRPPKLTAAQALRRWVPLAPRYVGLLFASQGCLLFGIAYTPLAGIAQTPETLPPGLDILARVVPMWVFGTLWLLTGVAGIATIGLRRKGAVVFAGMVSMYALWFASYTASWLMGDRTFVAGAIFYVLTGMVYSLTRVDPPLWLLRLGVKWTRA